MPRKKRHLAPFERAQNVGIRRIAKRRLLPDFLDIAESRHVVKPTTADDADFRLHKSSPVNS